MTFQDQLRLSSARNFAMSLRRFDEMPEDAQARIREAVEQMPTHPDIADNDEAIRAIAEEFWPDMKEST